MKRLILLAAMLSCFPSLAQDNNPPGARMPDGFVRIATNHWAQRGMPPTLQICGGMDEVRGIISNTATCSKWLDPAGFIQQRFDGKAQLTHWEFDCPSPGGMPGSRPCTPSVVLYYRVVAN